MLQVVASDLVKAEVQVVDSVVDLLQTDVVLLQDIADEDLVAEYPDGAVAADAADEVVERVVVGLGPARHGSGGCAVELRRPLHGQGLMRAEFVELVAEEVELELLGQEAGGRRDGGVPLRVRCMRSWTGVLLRLARLDELWADAELDEPGGEGRETGQGAGGEGDTVVGADAIRQAVLEE